MRKEIINEKLQKIYPNQKAKYTAVLNVEKSNTNDEILIYEQEEYYHIITNGISELFQKETGKKDDNGYGFEFTFKLKKENLKNIENEISCICTIMQDIARITLSNNYIMQPYQYFYTGQSQGIDSEQKSKITGFISVLDDKMQTISTDKGPITFVELIGVTDKELKSLILKKIDVKSLYKILGTDITSFLRNDII